ncbi:MAG TPA: hypothetical protein VFB62_00970, partial [Polyangiaceae bacterium]|nr:hypothetical protein [Polyangiaceae bacterium]
TLDIMVDDGNWALTNDADLIFFTDFGLKIAARYTLTHAFYSEGLKPGAEENTPTHRVGPAFVQTIYTDREGARWNEVSIVLLAQWWVKHRYRTGENVHQGIPYALLALVQRGDFYP